MSMYRKQNSRKRNGWLSFVVTVATLVAVGVGISRCPAADLVAWEPNIPVAISKARAGGKLVLLHFYGDACPPCRLMDRDVFSRPDVAATVAERYVAVKINSPDAPDLVRQLNLTGIPADVVLIPDGTILMVHTGGLTAGDFIRFLGHEDFQAALRHYRQVMNRVPAAPVITQPVPMSANTVSTTATPQFRPRPEITVPRQKITVAGTVGMAATRQVPLPSISLLSTESTVSLGFADMDVSSWAATAIPIEEAEEVDVVVVVSEPTATMPWQLATTVAETVPPLPVTVMSEPTTTDTLPWLPVTVAETVPPLSVSGVSVATDTIPWQDVTLAELAVVKSVAAEPAAAEPVAAEPAAAEPVAVEPAKLQLAEIQPAIAKNAQNTVAVQSEELLGLVFEGYCPVELVENSRWVRGEFRLTAVKDGGVYLFSSVLAKEQFEKTPQKYIPAASGGDVVVRKHSGQTILGLRKYGVEYNSKIYLFVSPETLETFSAEPERFCENVSN